MFPYSTYTNIQITPSQGEENSQHDPAETEDSVTENNDDPTISGCSAAATTVVDNSPVVTQPPSHPAKKQKTSLASSSAEKVIEYLKTRTENTNPIDIFFTSMCESTKKLPVDLQIRVKREIFHTVMAAEEENFCRINQGQNFTLISPPINTNSTQPTVVIVSENNNTVLNDMV